MFESDVSQAEVLAPSALPDGVSGPEPHADGVALREPEVRGADVVRAAETVLERAFRSALSGLGAKRCGPGEPGDGHADELGAPAEPQHDGVRGPSLPGLEDVRPSPALARILADIETADLTDDALVEVVAAAERLRSWALALQARAVRELTDRAGGSSVAVDGVSAGVGARLCLTRPVADGLVGLAAGLDALPELADALADGRVDQRRANVLLDGATELPRESRRDVVAALVGGPDGDGAACRLTPPRLRTRLRRVIVAHDPDGGPRRRERARADRNVRFEPAGECMAYLTALLPAEDAARARAGLDDLAVATHRASGETRTLDQVRADALVALLSGSRPVVERVDGRAEGVTDFPGCADVPGCADGTGGVSADLEHRLCGWTSPTVRTVVHVTVAASTLLGMDDHPGGLSGFGPIPADMVRDLAVGADTTWQRIVTDPVTGIATDVSRRTYRPGAVLGDLVRVRDATCTFPGCAVPAWRCDLDHVERFDLHDGSSTGQTRADNLHPVCRRHHNLKTHGGWTAARDPDTGAVAWGSPTGHRHVVGAHVVGPVTASSATVLTPHGVETRRPTGSNSPPGPVRSWRPPRDAPPF